MTTGYDDLTTPLHRVTFCVVDLETTGGSPGSCGITEVGAALFRGGERLGTFQTLVDPGAAILPAVSALTGITDAMVSSAPPIGAVIPSLLEFLGGAVLVGHNVRFDARFLDAALASGERPLLDHRRVDTVALARRLVREDVPDCKLGTLAVALDLEHRPTHRALDDVLATADLLHHLLERAASFGVTALDDLLALPHVVAHPHAGKLRLTIRLPRSPGAYLFRDRQGRPLHAGAASDVRTRVRGYFAGEDARVSGQVLRTAHTIEHVPCGSSLEAAVAGVRLHHALAPRQDRGRGAWRSYRYVTLARSRIPRLTVARAPRAGAVQLGPLPSAAAARRVVAAIEAALAATSMGAGHTPPTHAPAPARSAIDGDTPAGGWRDVVERGLAGEPALLLAPLVAAAEGLTAVRRPAAAAGTRRQAAVLANAVDRQQHLDRLRRAGRLVLELPGGGGAELVRGRLVRTWTADGTATTWAPVGSWPASGPGSPPTELGAARRAALGPVPLDTAEPPPVAGPVPLDAADELTAVACWLDAHADRVRVRHAEGPLASPWPPLPALPPEDDDLDHALAAPNQRHDDFDHAYATPDQRAKTNDHATPDQRAAAGDPDLALGTFDHGTETDDSDDAFGARNQPPMSGDLDHAFSAPDQPATSGDLAMLRRLIARCPDPALGAGPRTGIVDSTRGLHRGVASRDTSAGPYTGAADAADPVPTGAGARRPRRPERLASAST